MYTLGSNEVRKLFLNSVESVRLNHGSYGLSPTPVTNKRFELLKEQEDQPDVWFRMNSVKFYRESIFAAAKVIDADPLDTFVIDNATTGINCVLKSLKFEPAAEVLLTTHTYLAIQNTAKDIENLHGFKRNYLQITFPINNEDELVSAYEKKLSENSNIKIAVIDHITSPSAIVFPVKKLIDLCRKYNVISVVDGAHAPGQLKLSMKELEPDYYVGNFYKWMYTSRSCAVLYISSSNHSKILPLITSNLTGTLHERFGYWGTRDCSNYYTLPTALEFYNHVGGLEAITSYSDELLTWAQKMLCEALGTKPLDIPHNMRAPCMAVIGLPEAPKDKEIVTGNALIVQFWKTYSVQACFPEFNDKLWLRLSANIYNTKDDFLKLRDCLMDYYGLSSK